MAEFSVADELIKLKGLLDAGVLTQEEFETQKAALLSKNVEEVKEQSNDLEDVFSIKYVGFNPESQLAVIKAVRDLLGLGLVDGMDFVLNPPRLIKAKADSIYCNFAKSTIEKAGGKVEVTKVGTRKKEVIDKEARKTVRCPNCGSTSITTGPRGVNFTMGLIGASKTVNRCAKCGKMWTPGK